MCSWARDVLITIYWGNRKKNQPVTSRHNCRIIIFIILNHAKPVCGILTAVRTFIVFDFIECATNHRVFVFFVFLCWAQIWKWFWIVIWDACEPCIPKGNSRLWHQFIVSQLYSNSPQRIPSCVFIWRMVGNDATNCLYLQLIHWLRTDACRCRTREITNERNELRVFYWTNKKTSEKTTIDFKSNTHRKCIHPSNWCRRCGLPISTQFVRDLETAAIRDMIHSI